MRTIKQKQESKNLEQFTITKLEALKIQGGQDPVTERGTVTTPAEPEPPT